MKVKETSSQLQHEVYFWVINCHEIESQYTHWAVYKYKFNNISAVIYVWCGSTTSLVP